MSSFADNHPSIDTLTTELVDGAVGLKRALADGQFQPSEIGDVVRSLDPALGDYIEKIAASLQGLYPEVTELAQGGPFKMLMEAGPYFANKLMGIFS